MGADTRNGGASDGLLRQLGALGRRRGLTLVFVIIVSGFSVELNK